MSQRPARGTTFTTLMQFVLTTFTIHSMIRSTVILLKIKKGFSSGRPRKCFGIADGLRLWTQATDIYIDGTKEE